MRGSILLVEDDPDIRTALASILLEEGYAVASAENGRVALERLRQGERPDVILLDLMMPVMGGAEFRARQLDDPGMAAIPVVILTADAHYDRGGDALRADAAFAKPFEIHDLLDAIARVRARCTAAAQAA